MLNRSRMWGAALGAVATLAVGGAVLVAAGAFANGGSTINGCVKTSNGALRVVAAGTSCLPSEQAISWNQQGPTGPQGPAGPAITFVQRSVVETVTSPDWTGIEAWCLPGEVVTGGGYSVSSIGFNDKVNVSGPAVSPTGEDGWVVNFHNDSGYDIEVGVVAICAQYPA